MKAITIYLLNNIDVLKDVVNEINSWDGGLEDLVVFENDEYFFDTFFENNPSEAVRATCYGSYLYMDEYVKFNAYGNLESLNDWEYIEMLKDNIDDIIDVLVDEYCNISIPNELEELVVNYLEENDNEEE